MKISKNNCLDLALPPCIAEHPAPYVVRQLLRQRVFLKYAMRTEPALPALLTLQVENLLAGGAVLL